MASLIIDGITTTLYGVQTYDIVQIINGGALDVQAYDGTVGTGTIEIHANNILIDATSSILGDTRGFRGSGSASPGEGPGGGTLDAPGSGAGYGGNGGGTNGLPGMAYGAQSGTDIERGSGGGCGNTGTQWGLGGNGGALIALYATTIEIAGIISSNGGIAISAGTGYPHFTGSGGGSGGGILLSGGTIIVSGTLSANGGPGSDALDWYHTGGDGGAGGRIKLFPSSVITFTGIETVTGGSGGVSVGPGPGLSGENGTIYHADIPTTGDVNFRVTCESTPCADAYITIDANTFGPTNTSGIITVTGLPPVLTNYTVSKTGYYDGSESVTVIAGSIVDAPIVDLVLIPTTGDVCIKSNPSGASITIDVTPQVGKITALSGGICNPENTVTGLTVGTDNHAYEIALTGYQPATNLFSIVAGMVTDIDIGNLVPLPGNLTINITPSDSVYNVIDSLGSTVASNVHSGTTVSNLTPGIYSSTLSRTGYQGKLLSNIVIGPGESVTLTDILTPLPTAAGGGGFALLSLGLLFGLILGKKKCEDKHTKEECEKSGCQWKDGKCIERKY